MGNERHYTECSIKRASLSMKRYAFALAWPLACWHCNATGYDYYDECEHCLGRDRCPRCSHSNLGEGPDGERVCLECNWDSNWPLDHMPPAAVCVCDIEESLQRAKGEI